MIYPSSKFRPTCSFKVKIYEKCMFLPFPYPNSWRYNESIVHHLIYTIIFWRICADEYADYFQHLSWLHNSLLLTKCKIIDEHPNFIVFFFKNTNFQTFISLFFCMQFNSNLTYKVLNRNLKRSDYRQLCQHNCNKFYLNK